MIESNTSEPVGQLTDGAMAECSNTVDGVGAYLKNGVDRVVQTSHHLSNSAQSASARTVHFIQDEPIKSVLIAAATGAALVALTGILRRPSVRS